MVVVNIHSNIEFILNNMRIRKKKMSWDSLKYIETHQKMKCDRRALDTIVKHMNLLQYRVYLKQWELI